MKKILIIAALVLILIVTGAYLFLRKGLPD